MFAVTLADQTTDNGLAYVLKADEVKANYQTGNITLTFRHQLAKIRVKLEGAKAGDVTSVSVKSRTSCTVAEGNVTAGTDEDYIAMRQATYNSQTYWEANVVPDVEIKDFLLNGNVDCQLTQTVMPQAGHVHEVNINVNDNIPNDATLMTADNCKNINSGKYVVEGAFNNSITITGGSPDIYLDNVNISVENATPISITNGANATIHVVGASNNVSTTGYNSVVTGVYVDENSTVTIEGNGTGDALKVQGGIGAAGIGGYTNYTGYGVPCGKIIIRNVTLTAISQGELYSNYAAGIGTSGDATIGYIEISNAVVYAQGGGSSNQLLGAAAIGGGINVASLEGMKSLNIKISDSKIHATRGCPYASYIGAGGINLTPAGYDIISTAVITNSVIYNESGTEITQ